MKEQTINDFHMNKNYKGKIYNIHCYNYWYTIQPEYVQHNIKHGDYIIGPFAVGKNIKRKDFPNMPGYLKGSFALVNIESFVLCADRYQEK